jgi:DNA primase
MGIVDEDIVRVREATDLVAVVSQYLQLKRTGRRWKGLCPFHAEKTPSFSVNGEEGLYYCFGCQAKGDAITFVREIEHLDFAGAVEWLAAKGGITLRYTDRAEGEGRKRRARLVDAMEAAVAWYHERLLHAPDAGAARSYLRRRGISGDDVRAFRIGWAPDAWDELARALKLPDNVLVDSGLGFLNRGGRQTDAFRARVLFPIFDASGDAVAFGGRNLPGADGPKYKNSPATPIYEKTKVLYGLNWAKGEIVTADQAIVCEGYTDVIGFAQVGITRAVATCGTALTEEHLRLLGKFARRVVLAFDADAAGQAAAERFYAWEHTLGLDVSVAALPPGVDPGDLAGRDPEGLRKAVDDAVPFLGFRVERALAAANLSTPEGRARAAEGALAMIREHPNDLVRDQYLMEVASRCSLEPARLREMLRRGPARSAPASAARPRREDEWRETPESEALRLAVHQPEAVAAWLHESLFLDERNAAVFRALAASTTLHEAIERADPGAAELLQRLAVEDTDAEPDDVVARLVVERARRAVRDVDDAPMRTWVLQRMHEAAPDSPMKLDASEQLLRWLVSRSEEPAHSG